MRQSRFAAWGLCNAGLTRIDVGDGRAIIRPHGLPLWTLNRTVEGRGAFRLGSQGFTTEVDDFVLIPPGIPNDYGPAQGHHWHHQWVTFKPDDDWADLLAWHQTLPGHARHHPADHATRTAIDRTFKDLISVSRSAHPRRDRLGLALLETILCRIPATSAATDPRDPRLQAALDHASQNLDHPLAIEDLAQVAGLSPSRFAHHFRHEMGLSPYSWIERQRVAQAGQRLLMTNASIAHIASRVGYTDPAHFARVFKKHTGYTPSQYRKQSR